MQYVATPLGARVLVKILSNEYVTTGGILVPEWKDLRDLRRKQGPEAQPTVQTVLQLVEILKVGEGRYDPQSGTYRGSRFKAGDKVFIRSGPSAQIHIDDMPGRADEMLVLEDVIVCAVDFSLIETSSVVPALATP